MSNYIKTAKNPKTNKKVKALFLDNYFGSRRYGVVFRKDGKDAGWQTTNNLEKDCDIYPIEEIILTINKIDNPAWWEKLK